MVAELIEEIGLGDEPWDSGFFQAIVSLGVKKALVDEDARLLAPLVEAGMESVLRGYMERATRDYLQLKVRRELERRAASGAFVDPFKPGEPNVNPH